MAKIKIPSKNALIYGHYLYKGYYCNIIERNNKSGDVLNVLLITSGSRVPIHINNLIFIMPDGEKFVYENKDGVYTLKKFSEHKDTLLSMTEDLSKLHFKEMPTKDTLLDMTKELSTAEYTYNSESSTPKSSSSSKMSIQEEEPAENELLIGYNHLEHIRNDISINDDIYTKNFFILVTILGLDFDNTSVNIHGKKLQEIENHKALLGYPRDTEKFIKTLCMVYIFIHLNNLDIGIPVAMKDCDRTPGDDPRYLICICMKNKYIQTEEFTSEFIELTKVILKILNTEIVPSISLDSQSNKRVHQRNNIIHKTLTKKTVTKQFKAKGKLKSMVLTKLKSIPKKELSSTEKYVKDDIVSRLKIELQTFSGTNKKIMEFIVDNFENLVQPRNYAKLLEQNEPVAKIVKPFINEYKRQVRIIDSHNQVEKVPVNDDFIISEISRKLGKSINEQMEINKNKTYSSQKDKEYDNNTVEILKYLHSNLNDIVNMSNKDIQLLLDKFSLSILSRDFHKRLIDEIIIVRNNTRKLIEDQKRQSYLSNVLDKKRNVNIENIRNSILNMTLSDK